MVGEDFSGLGLTKAGLKKLVFEVGLNKEKLGNMRFERTKRGTGNMSARHREEVMKVVVVSGRRLRWHLCSNLTP